MFCILAMRPKVVQVQSRKSNLLVGSAGGPSCPVAAADLRGRFSLASRFDRSGASQSGSPQSQKVRLGYAPVVTGSMRNRVRGLGIEALRGADDGRCLRRYGEVGDSQPGVSLGPPPGFFISVHSKGS